MLQSYDNLRQFREFVRVMDTVPAAEEFVRNMLSRNARSCPLPVLSLMANAVIEGRQAELRAESEKN